MQRSASLSFFLFLFSITCLVCTVAAQTCSSLKVADCDDQPGCTTCSLNNPWSKGISFCVAMSTAEELPPSLFTCDDVPAPPPSSSDVELQQGEAAELNSDECSDLDKSQCEAHSACSWCVSAAVPSSCYTVEQAKRLPAAVFRCELPQTAEA